LALPQTLKRRFATLDHAWREQDVAAAGIRLDRPDAEGSMDFRDLPRAVFTVLAARCR
jgi:hypothetical protein